MCGVQILAIGAVAVDAGGCFCAIEINGSLVLSCVLIGWMLQFLADQFTCEVRIICALAWQQKAQG